MLTAAPDKCVFDFGEVVEVVQFFVLAVAADFRRLMRI